MESAKRLALSPLVALRAVALKQSFCSAPHRWTNTQPTCSAFSAHFLFRLKSCKIEFGICVLCLVDGLSVSELYRHLPLLCESPHINLSNTFCLPPLPSPLHRRHRNLSSQPNLQKRGGWSTTSLLNTRSSLGTSLQLSFTIQHVICNECRKEESLN